MTPESEQYRALEEWNATDVAFSSPQSLHELFETQVERTPEATALIFGEQRLTYRELNHRANQLAAHLRAIGVTFETVVACAFDRSPELVVGLLAILKAGGAYLPIDPRYPHNRISFMLQDSQAEILLTESRLVETFEAEQAQVVCLDLDSAVWTELSGKNLHQPSDPTGLAYVIYTSGSTGRPKGVEVEHRALVNHANAIIDRYGLGSSDRVLQFASPSFDVAAEEIFPTLASGGTIVLNGAESLIAPFEFLQFVDRAGITVLNLPAPYWSELVMQADRAGQPIPRGVRLMVVGSDRVQPESLTTWRRLTHNRVRWCNAYGVTEAAITTTIYEPKVEYSALDDLNVSIGRPLANTKLYVLDRYLQPVPIGVTGELYIGGVGVARGYRNRPGLTRESFLTNPFRPGERFYRTGDLARYRSTGDVELLGRADGQVKLRGFRIELGEIEVMARACPGVRDAIASVREDQPGQQRVALYVQPASEPGPDLSAVRTYLAERLPEYMVPSAFVQIATWPTTPNGKIDREALPAPNTANVTEGPAGFAPRSPVEQTLAEVWKAILKVGNVSVHDNFFELGGHSLLATQMASRIRETLDVELPLRLLFEKPTIAELAMEVERLRGQGRAVSVAAPIVRAPRDRPVPLSFSQQRMWLMYQLAPDGTAYNMPTALSMRGRLDRSALAYALEGLVRRHESFRTTFAMTTEGPVQIIGQPHVPCWEEIDLRLLPEANRLQEATRLITQDAGRPFDLVKGPLARVGLIQIGDDEHIFFLNMHHIVGDHWSFAVILRECTALYNDFCEGRTAIPEPSALQYADFAVWQRQWLNAEVLKRLLVYWCPRLAGLPVLTLPTDYPRPQAQRFTGSYRAIDLTEELLTTLTRLSVQRGSTLFMTLLAAFQILLGRYAGQEDVAVGVPIANRTHLSTEGIVGTFVNTLVMRADLSGNPTFTEMLRRVKEVALGAYDHQDLPFERLVEEMGVKRDLSYSPLVQVLFNVANAPMGKIEFHDLTWAPFEFDEGAAQFDLTMDVDTELTKKAYLAFRTDLFDGSTIERMLEQYKTLLEAVAADPQKNIADYQILSQFDRHLILHQWNATHVGYPHVKALPQLIEDQAVSTPDSIALSMDGRTLTYEALNVQANRLARHLRRLGVGRGELVGICLERSPMMVAGLLGILKAGAGYVPLDSDYPLDRLGFMVEDSGSRVIVTSSALLDRIPCEGRHAVCIDRDRDAIDREASTALEHPDPDDVAYVIYTSGSTGKPKGVEVTHRSLVNFLWSMRTAPGCTSRDLLLSVTTISFDIAGLELYLPLIVGGRVELVSRQVASDGRLLWMRLSECRPTIMQATPATWRMLIDAGWEAIPHLTALCGGEALPRELADQILARAGSLWNMYGPTETTIWSTLSKIEQGQSEITIGRPIANTQLYILDGSLQPVPIGVPGELYIGGEGVANGYRHRPELTAERFILHPFSDRPGARLYKTGDLARYRSDGRVVHLGRLDHQVKIRGFRIELGEVEAALSRHPAVRQVAVTAREDQHGLKQLAAYLVCQDGPVPTPTELRALLRKALPEYMMPSYFVFLGAMPLTANNKVDVHALPAPAASGASSDKIHVGPRNGMEVQLAALWQQVLGVHDPDVYDNFFDLGGHSLKAAQLFYLLEQVYGRQLPLATLFQAPTIAALASVLSREQWVPPWQSLVAIQSSGTATPIFMVPGVGGNVLIFAQLARLLGPDQPFYGLQARGLLAKDAPSISVPEMARHFVNEIQHLRPQGPYLIAGACTGGLIAYEIAQQLMAQGNGVTLLLMDTWHPSSYRKHPSMGLMGLWLPLLVVRKVWENFYALLRTSPKDRAPLLQIKAKRLMTFLQGGTTEDEKRMEEAWGIGMQVERITKATFHAVAHYEVQRYPGRLLNCIASERAVQDGTHDTRHEWPQLAESGSDTVYIAAGDSGRLFVSPHVEDLAGHIQRYVAKAADPAMTSDLPRARVSES